MIEPISSFKDLLNEISYCWEYPTYDMRKDERGYQLNKLYIGKDLIVSYKVTNYLITQKVYNEVEEFYEFLQRTDPNAFQKKLEETLK